MTDYLGKRQNTSLATDDQADLFEGYGNAATARPFDGELFLFSKGDYLAGQEKEDIPIGTRFKPKMKKLKAGWVYWQANAPHGLGGRRLSAGTA